MPPPPSPSPSPPSSQTVDPPVVDLAQGVVRPLPPELFSRLNPVQKFFRGPQRVIIFALISFFIGVIPVIALPPIVYLLQCISDVFHWPVRRFVDLCTANWLSIMTLVYELLYGIKIRTFGHSGKYKRRSLSMMNHVSHMDWMYYWSVVDRQGDLSYWKPVTKFHPLRNVPIIGHCMQMSCHLFIKRNWKTDKREFQKKLYYFNAINYPTEIFLFPEGGDLTPKKRAISDQYADENKLPRYQYCIHPRTTGFEYAINALRDGGLDAVYDVTIGFPDVLPKTEIDLWRGILPREVHFHIRKYDNKDVPEDREELKQWLKDCWREKEKRLKLFYIHGEFREEASGKSDGLKSPEVLRPRNIPFLLYSFFLFLSTNIAGVLGLMYVPYFWIYMISGCLFLWWGGRRGLGYEFMHFKEKDIEEELKKSRYNPRDVAM